MINTSASLPGRHICYPCRFVEFQTQFRQKKKQMGFLSPSGSMSRHVLILDWMIWWFWIPIPNDLDDLVEKTNEGTSTSFFPSFVRAAGIVCKSYVKPKRALQVKRYIYIHTRKRSPNHGPQPYSEESWLPKTTNPHAVNDWWNVRNLLLIHKLTTCQNLQAWKIPQGPQDCRSCLLHPAAQGWYSRRSPTHTSQFKLGWRAIKRAKQPKNGCLKWRENPFPIKWGWFGSRTPSVQSENILSSRFKIR